MLKELFSKESEENYAVKALREIENIYFSSEEAAKQVYDSAYLLLGDIIENEGIEVTPEYGRTETITLDGPDKGKRNDRVVVKLHMRKFITV